MVTYGNNPKEKKKNCRLTGTTAISGPGGYDWHIGDFFYCFSWLICVTNYKKKRIFDEEQGQILQVHGTWLCWTSLEKKWNRYFGPYCLILNHIWPYITTFNQFGPVWTFYTSLDHYGPLLTILDQNFTCYDQFELFLQFLTVLKI